MSLSSLHNCAKPMNLEALWRAYHDVRNQTRILCEPLVNEDYVVQSMQQASPVKWHLAHTTWFFETLVLIPFAQLYRPFHSSFGVLFNSYYNSIGPQLPKEQRGLLSRPTVAQSWEYRSYVDRHIADLLAKPSSETKPLWEIIVLGINHEQQHQELLLTDLKHAFASNPLFPIYRDTERPAGSMIPLEWRSFEPGVVSIGHEGDDFAFDNERPRHKVFLNGYRIANRPATNGEFAEFIADGGYNRPDYGFRMAGLRNLPMGGLRIVLAMVQ